MIRFFLFVALCSIAWHPSWAQLSEGKGHITSLDHKKYSCFLPHYFEVQDVPPGVIHAASGTFVIVVKVPDTQRMSIRSGTLSRHFFEDPGYTIKDFRVEQGSPASARTATDPTRYWMQYDLQGHLFERITTVRVHDNQEYLIIGNYPVVFRDQVIEEVNKIMKSFTIHR